METESPPAEEFCRLCLKPNPPYLSLFENRTVEMLEALTSITVSPEDPAPNLSCFKCFVELKCAYETQQTLMDTQILLQEKILGDAKERKRIEQRIQELGISAAPIVCENLETTDVMEVEPKIQPLDETDDIVDPNQTIFSCSSCPMEVDTLAKYKQHLIVHAKKKCLMCPEMVPADKFFEHNQTHESGFCEYCGRQLKHSGSLRKHVKLWHRGTKIKCTQCGEMLNNERAYDLHVRRIHTMDPAFMCDHCGKKFFELSVLNRHIKVKHSDEKPFVCEVCGKTFAFSSKLKEHKMAKHLERKLLVCEFCGKNFMGRNGLNVHKQRKHDWEPEKNLQCSTCDRWFGSKMSLSAHTSKKHCK